MSKIIKTVTALATPIAHKHGCEIWDVEYLKEPNGWVLRVYIDRAAGVSIEDCESVSRELDPILDEHDDLFPGSYTFEVSSAGLERKLIRPGDFERFIGAYVEIKLYKPKYSAKSHTGTLKSYNSGNITIAKDEEHLSFDKGEVASVRLRIAPQ